MSLKFTLTPVERDSFTPELLKQLLIDGVEFVNTIPSCISPSPSDAVIWSASKQDAEVLVWRTTHEAETWIARVTKADLPYLAVHRALVEDRAAAEKAWLDGPKDLMEEMGREELKELGIGIHDVRRFLNIQALAGREFLESVISSDMPEDAEGLRSFVVVSLPLEGKLVSASDVRGRYVSVDYVRELQDGEVEIFMALCSDAGGSIPRWVQNMSLPGQIHSDGKKFLEYMRKQCAGLDEKA